VEPLGRRGWTRSSRRVPGGIDLSGGALMGRVPARVCNNLDHMMCEHNRCGGVLCPHVFPLHILKEARRLPSILCSSMGSRRGVSP